MRLPNKLFPLIHVTNYFQVRLTVLFSNVMVIAISSSLLIILDRLILYEVTQERLIAELKVPHVKQVIWNFDLKEPLAAILSSSSVVLTFTVST